MDRPQPEELPLHDSVLSDAQSTEEILLARDAQAPDTIVENSDEQTTGIVGTGGETDSAERLSNEGGVGS